MRNIVNTAARNYRALAVMLPVALAIVWFRPASGTAEQRAADLCVRAETALKHGDDESAMTAYRESIAIHSPSVRARYGLAKLLAARGRFDEAKTTLEAISPYVTSPREWIRYARALRKARSDREAEAAYLRAVEGMPDNPAHALELAEFYLAAGNLHSADAHFRRAGALGGGRGRILAGLGRLHFSRGELDSAAACFRRALEESPGDVDLLCDVASTELRRRRPHPALSHVRRAVELDPHHARARYVMGQTLLALGHDEEAEAQLAVFERQSRLAARIRYLERNAAENPTAQRYQTLSHYYLLSGRDSLAGACLQRATALNPLVTAPAEAIGPELF
ncbi:MAG: tetratricopeptide repeat protein [Gemmatimonadota bacterium]|nr:tetratricopeptide repeat protein [Gemmatimonadota bacterium]